MELNDLGDLLKNKHIILDTNVLICLFEFFEKCENIITFLKKSDCALSYFPMIEFEFVRGAYEPEHMKKRVEFLRKLSVETMHFAESDIKNTIEIANVYAKKNLAPDMVDCCTASYLRKYSDKLFLATTNHKHFPLYIFDRLYIWTVDTENNIFNICFYRFNPDKFKKYI